MKNYFVRPGQSLFDIAIVVYGDVSGVSYLISDNNLSGPTERLYPGQMLGYREEAINMRRKIFLTEYETIATISKEDQPEGIGYWRLDEYEVQ